MATIRAAVRSDAQPRDLVRPGHIFPLRAVPGGVLVRQGHTEGSVDLAVMAGMKPAAILCEITNPDGTMAKGAEVDQFAERHGLVMLSIAELVDHHRNYSGEMRRRRSDVSLARLVLNRNSAEETE